MRWIDEIERVYSENFKETFEKLGLKRQEQKDGPGMGALIMFKNDFFIVQLLNDRGIIETDLRSLYGDGFRYIEAFYALQTLNKSGEMTASDRMKVLGTSFSYEEQSKFLINNFEDLKKVLNEDNHRQTFEKIDSLQRERFNHSSK